MNASRIISDPYQSEEYERFIQSRVPLCHCSPPHQPCDGVLAGGVCDGLTDERDDSHIEREPDEEKAEEDFRNDYST